MRPVEPNTMPPKVQATPPKANMPMTKGKDGRENHLRKLKRKGGDMPPGGTEGEEAGDSPLRGLSIPMALVVVVVDSNKDLE